MRSPQLLIYESDGRLARLFRALAEERNWGTQPRERLWSFHESRQVEPCLRLMRQGGPSVLLLKLGGDLERELTLLERTTVLFPETASIVVGDTENAALAGLAWDLGARYVLFPPQSRERLPFIVAGLLGVVLDPRPG